MFATLLGDLPRPPLDADAAPEAILDACLELQVEHGLEPLTDGGWPLLPDDPARSWAATSARAAAAGRLMKAVVTGPWTSGRPPSDVRRDLLAIVDAGCPWIEIHEPAAVTIAEPATADDADDRRQAFAAAHRELTAGISPGVHLSLAITGGAADAAGIDTILAGRYASLGLDLIDGADNWRLAAAAPTGVGIVCGVVGTRQGSDDSREILVWAANYAAATGGRGMDRVGLATAGSVAGLTWDQAAAKVRRLGEAARLAVAPPDEQRDVLDPRAFDIRSAALGRHAPPPPPREPRRHRPRQPRR
jgi:hypothetical protein